jgi:formate/nitrite transporter FocA (FNT family)
MFAGLLIGLGAYGFLALGGIPGAVIFTFGLVCVVLSGAFLYTGKAGVMKLMDTPRLIGIWFFNILVCVLIGLMAKALGGEPVERASSAVASRLAQGPWRSLLRSIGCGMIIDIAVWLYRTRNSILPVLFGVPLFIVCGFYHSIADVVYIFAAKPWTTGLLWYYPVIVLGNWIGCNVRRVVLKDSENAAPGNPGNGAPQGK